MKKIIYLSVFALLSAFVTLESCKKSEAVDASNSSQSKEQFFDGDEYDKGLVVEVPEEVEEVEKEETDYESYESEAKKTKIVSITSDYNTNIYYKDTKCSNYPYKYANCLPLESTNTMNNSQNVYYKITLSDPTDSIMSITANNNVQVIGLTNFGEWAFSAKAVGGIHFTKKKVKFTVTLKSGTIAHKSVDMVGILNNTSEDLLGHDVESFYYPYGTSKYSAIIDRNKIGKSKLGILSEVQSLDEFIPQLGDVIYFGASVAVIVTTPVKKTAKSPDIPSVYKFKISEMNGKCNGKKYIKSIAMSEEDKAIKSADGVTYANGYFRN